MEKEQADRLIEELEKINDKLREFNSHMINVSDFLEAISTRSFKE